jgi:hypothetical protein
VNSDAQRGRLPNPSIDLRPQKDRPVKKKKKGPQFLASKSSNNKVASKPRGGPKSKIQKANLVEKLSSEEAILGAKPNPGISQRLKLKLTKKTVAPMKKPRNDVSTKKQLWRLRSRIILVDSDNEVSIKNIVESGSTEDYEDSESNDLVEEIKTPSKERERQKDRNNREVVGGGCRDNR